MSQIDTTQSTSLSSSAPSNRVAAAASVIRFLRDAEPALDLGPSLTGDERDRLLRLSRRQPAAFLEAVGLLAEQHGGRVLGMPFDTKACREAIEEARQARALARAARKAMRRVEERAAAGLVPVIDQALAVTAVIERLRHTDEGRALADELTDLRRAQKKRKAKAKAPSPSPVPILPITPPTGGAPPR